MHERALEEVRRTGYLDGVRFSSVPPRKGWKYELARDEEELERPW